MTLLPLSCLCVIVWAWPVSCSLPKHEYNINKPEDFETNVMKAPNTSSIRVSWYPCGDGWCVCNATHADCRNRSLHYIPQFPPRVRSLDFSLNKPHNTENDDFFDNVTNLVWLDFSEDLNLNFSSGTFERLIHLSFFDLSFSTLSCSSLTAVLGIASLEVLKLKGIRGCKLLEFQDFVTPVMRLRGYGSFYIHWFSYLNLLKRVYKAIMELQNGREADMFLAFHNMRNLTYIDMSYESLSCEALVTFLAIPSLQELILVDGTKCQELDFTLKKRKTNMTRLDLSRNKISVISPLSLPSGLKFLNISCNLIKSMTFLSAFIHLQVLDMGTNVVENDTLVCQPSLRQLAPSHNDLNDVSFPSNLSCFPNLTKLNLHSNKIPMFSLKRILDKSIFFPNLEVLDVSGQTSGNRVPSHEIYKVLNVPRTRLKSLNLADNNIPFSDDGHVPANSFLQYPYLSSLSLAANDLSAVSEGRFLQLFGHLVHLQQLSLRSTGLRFIPPAMFSNFRMLTSIDLSHNSLITVPAGMLKPLPHMKMLNLSFNKITVVHETTFPYGMRRRLQRVDLSANPLVCSCNVLWFRSWLLTSPSVFAHSSSDYLCANLPTIHITVFSMTEQMCLLSQETSKFIIATVSLIFLGLNSLAFAYRYRWHIRLVLHEVFRSPEERLRRLRQHRFQYDVFVCYDSEDFPWVRDHLIPSLEEGMGLKLCLHHRDFIPGTPIVDNIQDSVVASKKMLMLFSRQFAKSPWCQFELRLCLTHAIDTQDVLIVVLLEDIPSRELTSSMMAVMKTTTYIEWSDEVEARDSFWRRMGLALHEVVPYA